jgi:hypothetical protein
MGFPSLEIYLQSLYEAEPNPAQELNIFAALKAAQDGVIIPAMHIFAEGRMMSMGERGP